MPRPVHLLRLVGVSMALAFGATGLAAQPAFAAEPAIYANAEKLAVGGYDPVSYFNPGGPTVGLAKHESQWNGAAWRFASAESQAKFLADPHAYAPQFGGYCAWAVSQGYIAPGDPQLWAVVEGKLYLNYNARAKELWDADRAPAIERARANWPTVLEKNQNR